MGEIVVRHFRRSGISSEVKGLVTEIVVEDSGTGRFLQRMEASRLTRPCFQTIDMRSRVAGECRRYAFNDRVHYLDDISFQMFEQGLQDNNGVYTVGTFEAIMSGDHTLQAQQHAHEAARRRQEEIKQRRLEHARAAARERGAEDEGSSTVAGELSTLLTDNPELLPLGYFRKRTHPRLQYACQVMVEHGNIRTNGMTRDISVCGTRVNIKGLTAFKVGQDVQLTFSGLLSNGESKQKRRIPYCVVKIETRDTGTALCLRRENMEKPVGFSQQIEALIEQNQRKYKLDVEDEYQSILSWLYERIYAQSAIQIPFFVEQNEGGDLRVQAVAMSKGNSHLARFFCTGEDNYNFTPLCLPHRLQHLESGQSYVLAMYRKRSDQDNCLRINSAADIEFSCQQDFQHFVSHAMQQSDYCIVKVHLSYVPASCVSNKKVEEVAQRLQYKSKSRMAELESHLERLKIVGYIVDVTQDFVKRLSPAMLADDAAAVWVGTECRDLSGVNIKQKISLPLEYLRPELIRFGYVERRREDRYLAETKVDVRIGDKSFRGMTRDISTRGMRIQLACKITVKKGATVKVGLLSLQQKKTSANLMDIPYRVINNRDEEAGTVLMLERILGGKQEGLKEFFVELITKNQHKLGVDVGDILGAATSRIYEALSVVNVPGIPFFLGRTDEGGAHIQFVGVPESGGSLQTFFREGDTLDFRCLNQAGVVSALYDAIQILLRQSRNGGETPSPFELELYVYKEFDAVSGETFIHATTDLGFSSDARREAFLAKFTAYEAWRCLKVAAIFTQPLAEKELEKMIQSVRAQSRHRAIKLSSFMHSLVGYGEMVDITDEWASLRNHKASG